MKCIVLVVVFMTATVFSEEEDVAEKKKRAVDVTPLTQAITSVINDLAVGLYASQLLPRVDEITAQAKAVDCGADDQPAPEEIDDMVARMIEAIKSKGKTGTLDSNAAELNRGCYLLAGITDYLIENDSDASKCEAVVAIWATGQAIHDSLAELGETFIKFNANDNVEDSESGRAKRRLCVGDENEPVCYDISWDQ